MRKQLFVAVFITALLCRLVVAGQPSEISPDISAGGRHVLALKKNGEVWAWGANTEGQLGVRNIGEKSAVPIKVPLPAGRTAVAVSGGDRHSLVLLDNHTVLAFGGNGEGQLGTADKGLKKYGLVGRLTDVTAIAAGDRHSMVLKKDGTVWTFGSNICGQLGDGTRTERTAPVEVVGLPKVKAIAAGLESSFALTQDGHVLAWGIDVTRPADQTNRQVQPIPVKGLTGIKAIAVGWGHAVALKGDGTVWFWGRRWNGAVGIKDTGNFISQPQEIAGIHDAVQIAAGSEHTVIVRSDGSMWGIGSNTKGQLGTEEAWPGSLLFIPRASVLKKGVGKVTAGIDTTYALKKDGTIGAFGSFESGQMGDGTLSHASPVQVYEETQAAKVTCGASHTTIQRVDGSAGWLGFYETEKFSRGKKSADDQSYRLKILTSLGNITQIASGDNHTLLRRSDGTVWAYGKGDKGQLGNGKNGTSMEPVPVTGITNAIAIAAGGDSSLAICGSGQETFVVAWGSNEFGQLGDGTTHDRSTPVRIFEHGQIVGAAMSKNHALVYTKDGHVWIWGNTKNLQIIENEAALIKKPQQVAGLADVQSVVAGEGFSLALLKNKTVVAWGASYLGQLGLGNTVATDKPTMISELTGVLQIAAGTWHGLARLDDGTVKAWGLNDLGQLGDGTFNNHNSPVTVKGLTGISDIAAGERHSVAVRNDHTAWSWGSNEHEQLGVSATKEHRSAIRLTANYTDIDADGIPDEKEQTYFGNLLSTGVLDSDGDGWTDAQEILFGTNPTLPDTDSDNLRDIADSSIGGDLNQFSSQRDGKIAARRPEQSNNGDTNGSLASPEANTGVRQVHFSNGGSVSFEKIEAVSNSNSHSAENPASPSVTISVPANGQVL